MRFVGRKHLVALMVPAFLAAHLVCICAQSALAASVGAVQIAGDHARSASAHDCCRKHGGNAPQKAPQGHSPRCQHCSVPQLRAPDSVPLSAPALGTVTAILSSASTLPGVLAVSHHAPALRGNHSPPPRVLELKCVLLVCPRVDCRRAPSS